MRLSSLKTSSGYFAETVIYAKCALNIAILFLTLLLALWAIVPIFIIALSGAVISAYAESASKLKERANQVKANQVKPALTLVENFVSDNMLSSDNVLVVSHI